MLCIFDSTLAVAIHFGIKTRFGWQGSGGFKEKGHVSSLLSGPFRGLKFHFGRLKTNLSGFKK